MNIRGRIPMRRVVNIFGAVGYTVLIFSYVVAICGVWVFLVKNGWLASVGMPPEMLSQAPRAADLPPAQATDSSPIAGLVVTGITAFMAIVTIFIAITLPYWLGYISSQGIKRAIHWCNQTVTLGTLLLAKLIACGVGAVPIAIVVMYDTTNLVLAISQMVLVGMTLLLFTTQHYLAKSSEVVNASDVW